jgi:hypothetical protein
MTRDEAVQFAREMYAAWRTMPVDEWRAHVNQAASHMPEQWRAKAVWWMEVMFQKFG